MKYGRFWFVSVVRWIWIRSVCDNATMPIPEMTKLSSVCSTLEHKHDIRCLCCYRNYSFGHNWIRHSHTNLFWLLLNAQKTLQSADVWWKMLFQEQLTPNKNTKSIWQFVVSWKFFALKMQLNTDRNHFVTRNIPQPLCRTASQVYGMAFVKCWLYQWSGKQTISKHSLNLSSWFASLLCSLFARLMRSLRKNAFHGECHVFSECQCNSNHAQLFVRRVNEQMQNGFCISEDSGRFLDF